MLGIEEMKAAASLCVARRYAAQPFAFLSSYRGSQCPKCKSALLSLTQLQTSLSANVLRRGAALADYTPTKLITAQAKANNGFEARLLQNIVQYSFQISGMKCRIAHLNAQTPPNRSAMDHASFIWLPGNLSKPALLQSSNNLNKASRDMGKKVAMPTFAIAIFVNP